MSVMAAEELVTAMTFRSHWRAVLESGVRLDPIYFGDAHARAGLETNSVKNAAKIDICGLLTLDEGTVCALRRTSGEESLVAIGTRCKVREARDLRTTRRAVQTAEHDRRVETPG
jgi:hypothetical protein